MLQKEGLAFDSKGFVQQDLRGSRQAALERGGRGNCCCSLHPAPRLHSGRMFTDFKVPDWYGKAAGSKRGPEPDTEKPRVKRRA